VSDSDTPARSARIVTAPVAAAGTRPAEVPQGANEEKAAAQFVREMFTGIAGRYDLLNHLLSFQVDRYWRRVLSRQMVEVLRNQLTQPGARAGCRALDLCCGTGDQALSLAAAIGRGPDASIYCSDFAHPMLTRASEKLRGRGLRPLISEADALQLPFADHSFDVLVCSFGFRNLVNYRAGLVEIYRVLRPGGVAGILEFSEPTGVLKPFYSFYFHHVLPRVGGWISGSRKSYTYLPRSVNNFPAPAVFQQWMREAGYSDMRATKLTGGVAFIYRGMK
jgi:demethylmenaquinone methyltransferase / 2-methoxy-6-polyprenyl-1,4-benzoquinol methylase